MGDRVKKRGIEVKNGKMVSYKDLKFVNLSKMVAGRVSRLLSVNFLYQPQAFFK